MANIKFTGNVSDFLKIGVAPAGRGDLAAVKEILKARPHWLSKIGSHGRTMLWEASHRGKLPVVEYLADQGADLDACGTHYTPYFVEVSCYCIARFKKRNDVADFLRERGAKVDIHTLAFLGDHDGVAHMLKRSDKTVNEGHPQSDMVRDSDGTFDDDYVIAPAPWATPLCYALRGGNVPTVELLLKHGATVKGNEKNLFIAAKRDATMVRLLLEHGADSAFAPDVQPDEGELYDVITAFGLKVAPVDPNELVYLCRGDRGGNPDEVRRLLRLGANINHQDRKGKTALHRAAKASLVDTIAALLEHGASLDLEDAQGETPLFDAVRSTTRKPGRKVRAIRMLVAAGADPAHSNHKQRTAVDLAKAGRSPDKADIVRALTGRRG